MSSHVIALKDVILTLPEGLATLSEKVLPPGFPKTFCDPVDILTSEPQVPQFDRSQGHCILMRLMVGRVKS